MTYFPGGVGLKVPVAGEGEVHFQCPPPQPAPFRRRKRRKSGFRCCSAGNIASTQLSPHNGLGSCHCAFCHRFPRRLGTSGTPVGPLRSPHSQATGGDGPHSQGGSPALAGGWTSCERSWRLTGRGRTGVGQARGRQDVAVLSREASGSDLKKVSSLVHLLLIS